MTLTDRLTKAAAGGVAESVTTTVLYVAAAGLTWGVFYLLLGRRLRHRKINPRVPAWRQLGRETLLSLRSIVVFGVVTAGVVLANSYGLTRLYGKSAGYGPVWFAASILIAVVLHDAYFYWTHRLMHRPRLFRRVHRTHHLSTNPSPWAAYSFGVGEAFVQAGIGPLVVCLVPMHGLAFLLFMSWQIAFNVFGHLGYEIWPRWFLDTWAGKLVNSPTHHALHHEKFVGNYGLYFNVWDRLMGTNHRDYEARFRQATAGPSAAASTPAHDEVRAA